ncbi:hypothetical protein AB0C93_20415 [Streptomyces sp. NPDC048518]|uniref:hypothetical protein n=1 Tax=Streptomyces sp. NPDC048518 TaxID=3155029 RepID=UPI0033FACA00
MHRSTTTALLVSVAVSATVAATASGCVSVERPTRSGAAAATASPPAPRADGSGRPRVVQAPAREALERMDPPRGPAHRTAAPEAAPAAHAPAPGHHPPSPPPPPAPARKPPAPRPDAGATRPAPHTTPAVSGADVCALGEAYGNWHADSPQAVICRKTYER